MVGRTKTEQIKNIITKQNFWLICVVLIFILPVDLSVARVLDHDRLLPVKNGAYHRQLTGWMDILTDDHMPRGQLAPGEILPRFKRKKRAVDASGGVIIPKYRRDVAIFGMSVRFGHEKKRVDYTAESVEILEGLKATLVFYGRFVKGTKVRLNDNGHSCDAQSEEKPVELTLDPAGDSPPFPSDYVYTTATVDMTMETVKGYTTVYFCLLNPNYKKWEPQGTSPSVQIKLTGKLLPIYLHIVIIIVLLLLSGLFSGLNLGLMSLNKTDLKIIINTGTPVERKYAQKIAPVRNHGNFLLCCLLFSNVLVNATLTIVMDDITSGIWAVVVSTLTIVIFGEIIPQAICSRHGLAVGARTILLTKFFMVVTFVLAYPLSVLLDKALGEEIGSVYTRERLKELLKVTKDHHGLATEEVALISGALDMKSKTVVDIMTRIENVFMLPLETILDYETIAEIEFQGYTRIPIYDREKCNTVAVLNVKQLTLLDANDNIPVRTVVEYYQNSMLYVFQNTRLDYMFRAFREGNRGHMAFVQTINEEGQGDPFYETIGVVTMEDVLEELLQADILDETDVGKCRTRLGLDRRNRKAQDIPFMSSKKALPAIEVPPPLALAACQFLTTAVPAFNRDLISENILRRLVKTTVTMVRPPKVRPHEAHKYHYLYEAGKPADYFIMILEGRIQVEVGAEKIEFNAGPFQYFGAEFLLSQPSHENILEFKEPPPLGSKIGFRKYSFTPDYTAHVVTETYYMRVTFGAYRAARQATDMERRYLDPEARLNNTHWEEEVEQILTVADEGMERHHRRINYSDEEQSDNEGGLKSSRTPNATAAITVRPETKDVGTGYRRAYRPSAVVGPPTSGNKATISGPSPHSSPTLPNKYPVTGSSIDSDNPSSSANATNKSTPTKKSGDKDKN